jgi:hypothetical protein
MLLLLDQGAVTGKRSPAKDCDLIEQSTSLLFHQNSAIKKPCSYRPECCDATERGNSIYTFIGPAPYAGAFITAFITA